MQLAPADTVQAWAFSLTFSSSFSSLQSCFPFLLPSPSVVFIPFSPPPLGIFAESDMTEWPTYLGILFQNRLTWWGASERQPMINSSHFEDNSFKSSGMVGNEGGPVAGLSCTVVQVGELQKTLLRGEWGLKPNPCYGYLYGCLMQGHPCPERRETIFSLHRDTAHLANCVTSWRGCHFQICSKAT